MSFLTLWRVRRPRVRGPRGRIPTILALGALVGACAEPSLETPVDLVLTGARIITLADSDDGSVIEDGTVSIRGDRIVSVHTGPPSSGSIVSSRVVDLRGTTLMPGFVDAHTHVLVRAPVATSDSALDVFVADVLPGLLTGNLGAGVTTMVSTGDFWPHVLDIQSALSDGSLVGPRLHVMGPVFQGSGGHPAETICRGDAWCRERLAVEVDEPSTGAARVAGLAEQGVMGVKAVYSGGGERISPEAALVKMDPAVAQAIAASAGERGLRLAVHENFADRALEAIERGAAVLVHTPYSKPIEGTPLLERLAADRIPVMTTLWVAGPPVRDAASPLWAERFANRKRNAKALLDAGGLPVFGTDNFFIEPGEGIRLEIEALRDAGFSPIDIITTLTRNGAELLGLEHEQGAVEAGQLADLTVVRGDPLSDIGALSDVVLVIRGGAVVVDRLGDASAPGNGGGR